MGERKVMVLVGAAVLAIWLGGAAVTRYTLTEMAYLAPIAVVAVGLTIGIVLFWVKIITQMVRNRGHNGPFIS